MPACTRSLLASALLVLLSFVAPGCASEVELPANADPELREGQEIYGARCAQCHGSAGGGGIGPVLSDVENRLTVDEQVAVIRNGRNAMPRFDTTLSEEEIAAVVRFTAEAL